MSDDRRIEDDNDGKRFFRSSDRVFKQADGWYYSAREGDRGPYDTEQRARDELARFIQEQKDLKALSAGKSMKADLKVDRARPKADVWRGLPDVD